MVKPSDLNANNELNEGDTITQVQFKIFNFSAQSISGSDFPNGEIKISASYNGDFKITNNPLMGSINSQEGRVAKFPEDFNPYQPLPPFPAGIGKVELCIYTQYANDMDISNDTACIEFNVIDENTTVGIQLVQESTEEVLVKQGLNELMVTSKQPISISGLFDLTGQSMEVYSAGFNTHHTISLNELPSGVYILQYLTTDKNIQHMRFWVN